MGSRRELILHVGLPKTGTTALQKWFYDHRHALASLGLFYPDLHPIGEYKHAFLVPALRSNQLEQLRKLLLQNDSPVIFLSNEGLSNHFYDFDSEALASFREMTAGFKKKVILVTRQAGPWLKSYHKQCVINPDNGASELWGTSLLREELVAHPRIRNLMDHARLTHDMMAGYAAERVIHLEYEDDWFASILEHLGISSRAFGPLPRVNDSMPDWAIEVMRCLNKQKLKAEDNTAWKSALQHHLASSNTKMIAAVRSDSKAEISRLDLRLLQTILDSDYFTANGTARHEAELFQRFLTGFTTGPLEAAATPTPGSGPAHTRSPVAATPKGRCLYSFVLDGDPRFTLQAKILLATLRSVGIATGDIVAHFTPSVDGELVAHLKNAGICTTAIASAIDGRFCNKVNQLRTSMDNYETMILCDTDLAFIESPAALASSGRAVAKPVDYQNPPLERLEALRIAAGVVGTPRIVETTIDKLPTYSTNCNGGLYMLPQSLVSRLAQPWYDFSLLAFQRVDILDMWTVNADQIGFALAMLSLGEDVEMLPVEYNFPLHAMADFGRFDFSEPKILHYHACCDANGNLTYTGDPRVDRSVARANAVIAASI
jgi:hypothetical protein